MKKTKDSLKFKKESSWNKLSEVERKKAFKLSDEYMTFLDESKTERLCVENIIHGLKNNGFKDIKSLKKIKTGDKVFKLFKEKIVIAAIIGKDKSWNLIGSHTDSPRLDLKPNPLYEDSDLALLQSHYYGGIKKYQWVNRPLAMHGVVYTKTGKKLTLNIGENENDTKFIISDLLPHLAKTQMDKNAKDVVGAEQLNILVGNIPMNDSEVKEKIKTNILKLLKTKYDLEEEDFNFAEFEFVPAGKASNIGFDQSMIASYGQDDRICVFTSFKALLDIKKVVKTAIGFFVDKEEIGSTGDTGAQSYALLNFAQEYIKKLNLNIQTGELFENSSALSADVTAAFDPSYKDVFDVQNASYLGKGVCIEKYGGSGGKYSTNDASAEFMGEIRKLLVKNKLAFQIGEISKVDVGGGGTIAMFMSRYGMNCVHAGPCLLGMHPPCEISSKVDVYSAYELYKAFFGN